MNITQEQIAAMVNWLRGKPMNLIDCHAGMEDVADMLEQLASDNARFRDLLHGLLQVQDGVPMTGLAATKIADAARAALQEKPHD